MSILRRRNWQQRLRTSSAVLRLKAGDAEHFLLDELQEITNDVLRGRRFDVGSNDCDKYFSTELAPLEHELYMREAGLLACLHVLSYREARRHLESLREYADETRDQFFDARVRAYLQCVMFANKAQPDACSPSEADAAEELFKIVREPIKKNGKFPTIWTLLKVVSEEECGNLMPCALVKEALRRNHYQQNLHHELKELLSYRNWYAAWRLVKGMRAVCELPDAVAILRDVFPEYPMWLSWKPSRRRIELWEEKLPIKYWRDLAPILDLEGPDRTGQFLQTLRYATCGQLEAYGYSNGLAILDCVLEKLDQAIEMGPETTIDLFILICIKRPPNTPIQSRLDQLAAALDVVLELGDREYVSGALANYLEMQDSTEYNQMIAFTRALPIIGRNTNLQILFGHQMQLRRHATAALTAMQVVFCEKLESDMKGSERLGKNIIEFGRVLLAAQWLHAGWHSDYVEMLREIPTPEVTMSMFQELKNSQGARRQICIEYLADKIGACRPPGQAAGTLAPQVVPQDKIWFSELDAQGERLRRYLKEVLRNLDADLGVACLKQSLEEPSVVMMELTGILVQDTDQVCVNLASFLGDREKARRGSAAQCWKSLLLHMMRQRPPGMLDRMGKQLTPVSWETWIRSMRLLFVNRHLEPYGRLGFTELHISMWSARKGCPSA
jgi:hypothetical protein